MRHGTLELSQIIPMFYQIVPRYEMSLGQPGTVSEKFVSVKLSRYWNRPRVAYVFFIKLSHCKKLCIFSNLIY